MPDTSSDLRTAVVGYGLGGSVFHAPLVASTRGMRVAAIVTRDTERRAAAARAHPDAAIVDDVRALFDDALGIELVAVTTPNATHAALARAAIEARRHVVVDKPFAATADEARTLVAAAAARGVTVTPFQNRRWDGDFRTVQRLVHDGTLGDVFRFESRFERWRDAPKPRWRTEHARADAEGMLHDLGTHLIDQALVLFGPVRDVYAELDARHPDVRTADDAFVALTHRSGVRSRLWMSAVAGQSGPRFAVFGRRGTFLKHGLDPQEDMLKRGLRPGDADWGEEPPSLHGTLAAGDAPRVVAPERGAYERFYAGVRDTIRRGARPPVDHATVIAGLDVIEAAFRSSDTRAVMQVRA